MTVSAPPLEAAPRPIERQQADFSGGMNTRDDPTAIALNELLKIRNTRITKQRALQRRGGTEQNGNVATADTTSEVLAEYQYFDDDDVAHELRMVYLSGVAKLQELSGATWSDVTGGTFDDNEMPYFITFRGMIDTVLLSDTFSSATEYTAAAGVALTTNEQSGRVIKILAGTGAGQHRLILDNTTDTYEFVERWDIIPDNTSVYAVYEVVDCCYVFMKGQTPFMYEGTEGAVIRLEGLKRYAGAVVHKNKWLAWGGPDCDDDSVEWSTEGFGGDSPNYAHQEIYTSRGESIVGIAPEVNNRAVVIKNRTTHALIGDTIENFSVVDLDGGVGCVAPKTIKSYSGLAYWLSHRGVEICDGVGVGYGRNREPISDVIRPNVQEWSDELRPKFQAEIFNQRYYLAVAKDNLSTENDQVWVYDINFQAWVYDDGYFPACFGIRKDGEADTLHFGDSRSNGTSWQLETGTSDDGDDITMEIITGKLNMTTIARNKNFEKGYYVMPSTQNDEDLTVDRQVDDNGWVTVDTFDLNAGALTLPFVLSADLGRIGILTEPRFIIDQGHFLQHRFTNIGHNESVMILAYTVIATDLSLP